MQAAESLDSGFKRIVRCRRQVDAEPLASFVFEFQPGGDADTSLKSERGKPRGAAKGWIAADPKKRRGPSLHVETSC